MTRAGTIRGVDDVLTNLEWYESLFGPSALSRGHRAGQDPR
jgi:hypothetical protein